MKVKGKIRETLPCVFLHRSHSILYHLPRGVRKPYRPMPNNIIYTLNPPIRARTLRNPLTLRASHGRHIPVTELSQVKVGDVLYAFAGRQVG
jgi:hypothetical protein